MKVCITGRGFIASHLYRRLIKDGHEVHLIGRLDYQGDIYRCYELLSGYKPDVVYHLAAKFITEHGMADVDELVESNITYTAHLLDAMRMSGVKRLVTAGTGWQHYENCLDYDPVNLYAATKQCAEDLIGFYVNAYDFQAVTLKFNDTYGPDDKRKKLFTVLNESTEPLFMSEGRQIIDLLHIDDVVEGFVVAEKIVGDVYKKYFLSSLDKKTLREVVGIYEEVTGRKLNIIWGGHPYRKRQVMKPVIGKILPGWLPIVGLEDGIRRLNHNLVADGSHGY